MKSHIKIKIRAKKSLNDTEKKCAEIMGLYTSATGVTSVPELGLTGNFLKIILHNIQLDA